MQRKCISDAGTLTCILQEEKPHNLLKAYRPGGLLAQIDLWR